MASQPARFRPRMFPPPEFPPRRPARFARMPPAVFPVLLGFLGLTLALRAGFGVMGWPMALPDLVGGVALAFWVFGAFGYGAKLARRPGVLLDDLKVVPARGGLAAGTMGGMAAAGVLAPFAPLVATILLAVALVLHLALLGVIVRALSKAPPEARGLNPGWHLVFVGPVVGAVSAVILGLPWLATVIFWPTAAAAVLIWAASAAQMARKLPPPPLRPLLAIHLAPASLLASVAALTGMQGLAMGFGALGVAIFVALAVSVRWVTAAGFSPLWGAFTFPLAAFAAAMIRLGGAWAGFGLGMLALAAVAVPAIGWGVLRMWPKGTLAAKTNAAEA